MNENKTSRRQCFAAIARWGIAGVMSAVSVKLLSRKGTKEQPCIDAAGQIGCRACSSLSGCGLPKALSFKHFLSRNNG